MTDLRALIYIEIDIKFCALRYGVSPCAASGTGDAKCFNTRNIVADCQDPANFTPAVKTLRFGLRDCGYLPQSIDCIPLLRDASVTNAIIAPGESIGERATLQASFWNGPHGDAGIDPYISDRSYNPFNQGTFWGKFRARNTYLEGQPIRIIRGYVGQPLEEMDTEHFIIEKFTGPDSLGNVAITGVDFMKLLSSDSAMAPTPNTGYLSADVAAGATSLTLYPVGIGDKEYPSSGTAVIGKEIITFTRSGDNFTVSALAEEHEAEEVLQIPLIYNSKDAAYITSDLIERFSPINDATDYPAWKETIDLFSGSLYTRFVPKPTKTIKLINEMIEQAGLIMFVNTRTREIEFDALRRNSSAGEIIDSNRIISGSFRQIDQPKKRFNKAVVYFGKKDVFESNKPENFYSAAVYIAADDQYLNESTKVIYSEWIQQGALSEAGVVAARAVSRYRHPPRKVIFDLFAKDKVSLGGITRVEHQAIENAQGNMDSISVIVTGVGDDVDKNSITAEEYRISDEVDSREIIITLDRNENNINLRDKYSEHQATIYDSRQIIFILNKNVVIGSQSVDLPAMETGDWPDGVVPLLQIRAGGYIVGRGGDGGYGDGGVDGGAALKVTSPISIDNSGTIGGGGGGGGGGKLLISPYTKYRGGGGAGREAGFPYATLTKGGESTSSDNAGDGGNLGQSGGSGDGSGINVQQYSGGAPGAAIEGVSLITFINTGTIIGAQNG